MTPSNRKLRDRVLSLVPWQTVGAELSASAPYLRVSSWEAAFAKDLIRSRDAVLLDAANNIADSLVTTSNMERYRLWNEHVQKADSSLGDWMDSAAMSAPCPDGLRGDLRKRLRLDICYLWVEEQYADIHRGNFFGALFEVYESGRYPCAFDPPTIGGVPLVY